METENIYEQAPRNVAEAGRRATLSLCVMIDNEQQCLATFLVVVRRWKRLAKRNKTTRSELIRSLFNWSYYYLTQGLEDCAWWQREMIDVGLTVVDWNEVAEHYIGKVDEGVTA